MTEIVAGRLIDALASFVELRDTVERAAFAVTNSLNARYDALGDSCSTQAHRHLSDVAKIANGIRASLSAKRETCCGHGNHVRNGCATGGCACANPSDPRNQEVTK